MGNERIYKKGNTDDIKDILEIRLYMWDVKKNYPKNDTDTICPICGKERTAENLGIQSRGWGRLENGEK